MFLDDRHVNPAEGNFSGQKIFSYPFGEFDIYISSFLSLNQAFT